jgi:hypothetical protein
VGASDAHKKSMEEPNVIKITANAHKKGKIGLIRDRTVLKKEAVEDNVSD